MIKVLFFKANSVCFKDILIHTCVIARNALLFNKIKQYTLLLAILLSRDSNLRVISRKARTRIQMCRD